MTFDFKRHKNLYIFIMFQAKSSMKSNEKNYRLARCRGSEKVQHWIGNGIECLVAWALHDQFVPLLILNYFSRHCAYLKCLYAQCNGHHSMLYQGVREGLDWLNSQGCMLACITIVILTWLDTIFSTKQPVIIEYVFI
jgi:phosphoglycolate phosphatase-like HAD superfamily hydrolase